jgi:hypothetical protein
MKVLNLIFIDVVMDIQNNYKKQIFSLHNQNFEELAMELYRFQSVQNPVYHQYQNILGIDYKKVTNIAGIPYLPAEFFRSHKIISKNCTVASVFESSGTTASQKSKHYVADLALYKHSLLSGFELFFSDPAAYVFVFLLPEYLENKSSSLLYMVNELASMSKYRKATFYKNNYDDLFKDLEQLKNKGEKIFLWGLTSALVDFFSEYKIDLSEGIILETGGMKGRKPELTRNELHAIISEASGVKSICSEYGMTELLSQAYSLEGGGFKTVPWMKILIRDMNDPFKILDVNETGCINVIDLANFYSCAFIATDDVGRLLSEETFEISGRLDHSALRGCNLMLV